MSVPPAPFDPRDLLEHASWLRGLALALCSDRSSADDLVQETFLTALRQPPSPGSRRSLRAWLGQVARNRVRQDRRGAARRRVREERHAPAEALPSAGELASELDAQRVLADYLVQLPPTYQEVLLWRYYRGLEPTQIAERLGCPAGTVRSRLTRGLALLRERMELGEGRREARRLLALAGGAGFLPMPPLDPAGSGAGGPAAGEPSAATPGADVASSVSEVASSLATVPWGTGVLVMNAIAKLVAAAAVLGVAYFGYTQWNVEEPAAVGPLALDAPELVELETPEESDVALAEDAAQERRQSVTDVASTLPADEPEVEPAKPVEAAAPAPQATLQAVFVDEAGVPQPGIRLSLHAYSEPTQYASGSSDAAGELTLDVPLPEDKDGRYLARWGSEIFAHGVLEVRLGPGDERTLGTQVLLRGASANGRVVDPEGRPLKGVRVWSQDPELDRDVTDAEELDEEQLAAVLRLGSHGPFGSRPKAAAVCETSEDGTFDLQGLSVGEAQRLWAHRKGSRYAWSQVIVPTAGQVVSGIEMVLQPLAPEDRISGVILDPDGEPFGGAMLRFQTVSKSMSMSSYAPVDDQGRFDLVVTNAVPHSFTASDPLGRHAAARKAGVEPGVSDLVLQLGTTGNDEGVHLVVHDADGAPVEHYEVQVTNIQGTGRFSTSQGVQHCPNGETWLPAPQDDFEITVSADGYQSESAGPFANGNVPGGEIQVVLSAMPAVTGVVLAGGQPVPGARVALRELVDGQDMRVNGFRARVGWAVTRTEADEEGRFELYPPSADSYRLEARADGWGIAEIEPLVVAIEGGMEDQRLELPEAGSLVVKVLTEDGSDPAGVIVSLNRYDGGGQTHVTDENGEVRVEALTPGGWAVARAEREVNPEGSSTSSRSLRPGEQLEWPIDCTVRAGGTTVYELTIPTSLTLDED